MCVNHVCVNYVYVNHVCEPCVLSAVPFTAGQKTVELPSSSHKQEYTISSTSRTTTTQEKTVVMKDVAPVFTQPMPPETTVNERSTARSVA